LLVLLWQVGKVLGDSGNVVAVEVVRIGVGDGLRLVSNNVVPVWCGLVELLLEELWDERRRERENEGLRRAISTQ
jgi:hypothetical protein